MAGGGKGRGRDGAGRPARKRERNVWRFVPFSELRTDAGETRHVCRQKENASGECRAHGANKHNTAACDGNGVTDAVRARGCLAPTRLRRRRRRRNVSVESALRRRRRRRTAWALARTRQCRPDAQVRYVYIYTHTTRICRLRDSPSFYIRPPPHPRTTVNGQPSRCQRPLE